MEGELAKVYPELHLTYDDVVTAAAIVQRTLDAGQLVLPLLTEDLDRLQAEVEQGSVVLDRTYIVASLPCNGDRWAWHRLMNRGLDWYKALGYERPATLPALLAWIAAIRPVLAAPEDESAGMEG